MVSEILGLLKISWTWACPLVSPWADVFIFQTFFIKIYHIKKQNNPLNGCNWWEIVWTNFGSLLYTFPFMPHDDKKLFWPFWEGWGWVKEGNTCTLALYSLVCGIFLCFGQFPLIMVSWAWLYLFVFFNCIHSYFKVHRIASKSVYWFYARMIHVHVCVVNSLSSLV